MQKADMSNQFQVEEQVETGQHIPVDLTAARQPRYGRFLEEFVPGTTFQHPRGLTLYPAFAQAFATTFMQANPLYLDEPYARSHGFHALPVSPLMVLNVALSLGVQNDSEQAIAHLGYYNVTFPRPVYSGDTLRSQTTVLSRRFRGTDSQGKPKPGIVRVLTEGRNQHREVVVSYERAILIPVGKETTDGNGVPAEEIQEATGPATIALPLTAPQAIPNLTGEHSYFEDFTPGEIIVHANGRTVSEEHFAWTYRLGNTHPLHYDRIYSSNRSGPMSGVPIVYGGLVFAWLEGLASRDVSDNALWDLGYTEGYHTQPVVAGDTLYTLSRVLNTAEGPQGLATGVVTLQLIGVKNVSGVEALAQYGAALFAKETDKPRDERIPEKIFEIERRLLVKKRSAWLSA